MTEISEEPDIPTEKSMDIDNQPDGVIHKDIESNIKVPEKATVSAEKNIKLNEKSVTLQEKITELSVPILECVTKEQIENFRFFNERHYEDYYFTNLNKHGQYDDMCIRVHTNKLLLVTLARGNDIIQCGKNIINIDFMVNKGDRSKIKVKGKRKNGARQVYPDTILCKVKLEGEDDMRNIRAGVTGNLIEINEMIKHNPNVLKTDPRCDGFFAVVMPKGPLHEANLLINNQHLIKEEKYSEILAQRLK